jgi:uncharacterized surface protein with fasciclin (FAS1) repeats
MSFIRTVTFAAAAALAAGSAFAQAPAAPAVAAPAAEAPAAEAAPAAPPSAAAMAFKPLPAAASGNLQATLAASGQFTKFLAAAEKTGLGAFLTGTRELTILAPTDVAFESIADFDALMAANPPSQLQGLVVRHIIATKIAASQVAGAKGPVPTAAQTNVEIDGSVTPMKVNDAVVLQGDVQATNGVIYVVDKVL